MYVEHTHTFSTHNEIFSNIIYLHIAHGIEIGQKSGIARSTHKIMIFVVVHFSVT